MRILAIRGRNLASLEGDFHVDLRAEPFDDTGLFAVTGPTGAGKSTLLDALCLALFDTTPRLHDRRGGGEIGRADDPHRVSAHDVRNLLRIGAAEGFAEVDFVDCDGQEVRSRWEVRRAKRSSTGRLQPQTLSLVSLATGDPIAAGKKSEVLTTIRARLGLDFPQFQRSVLLAQGDFARFLLATDRERADLLEAMTGTALYSRLSTMAFERAKRERECLADLKRREVELGEEKLDGDERGATEERIRVLLALAIEIRNRIQEAHKASEWYRRWHELESRAREALELALQHENALVEASPRRDRLALVETVQPLRPQVEGVDAAARRARDALERSREAQKIAETATQAHEEGERALKQAALRAEKENEALVDAQPLLRQAETLDLQIQQTREQHLNAVTTVESARETAQDQKREHKRLALAVAEAEKRHEDAAAWLREHQSWERLVRDWSLWERQLADYAEAKKALAETEHLVERCEKARDAARAANESATRDHSRQTQIEKEARNRAEQAEDRTHNLSLEDLGTERDRLDRQKQATLQLGQLCREAHKAKEAEQRHRDATSRALAARLGAAKLRSIADEKLTWAKAQLTEAQRAHRTAFTAEDNSMARLRAQLSEGEPCPLCGSSHHPWSEDGSPYHGLVDELHQRVTELSEEKERWIRAKTEALAELARQADLEELHHRERLEASQEQATIERRWIEVRGELEPPLGVALDDSCTQMLDRHVAALDRALEEGRSREREAERQFAKAHTARVALEAERIRGAETRERCYVTARQQHEAEQKLAEALKDRDRAEADGALAHKRLAPVFSDNARWLDWERDLYASPQAFIEARRQEAMSYRTQLDVREHTEKLLIDLRPRRDERRQSVRQHGEALERQERLAAELGSSLEALVKRRAEIFSGKLIDTVRADLEKNAADARTALERARRQREETARELASAVARREESERASGQVNAEHLAARETLGEVLRAKDIDEPSLRSLLAHDPAWIEKERTSLAKLSDAASRARAVRSELRGQLEKHEEKPPRSPEIEVRQSLEHLTDTEKQLSDELAELRVRLRLDDERTKKLAEIATQLEKQAGVCDVSERLDRLIGSRDGNKFKVFAQGLTLELLLVEANEHLRRLAPRYRFERVPGERLEIQVVDQDLGDEVRSTRSLSGGESFLVSLALALGLSSLSAENATIESLFIDEGFGYLDHDTLEIALAALDALQASGRQVGVISHLPELAERIGARVHVEPLGGGRSRVRVDSGFTGA